jgi:hypothetical protein
MAALTESLLSDENSLFQSQSSEAIIQAQSRGPRAVTAWRVAERQMDLREHRDWWAGPRFWKRDAYSEFLRCRLRKL